MTCWPRAQTHLCGFQGHHVIPPAPPVALPCPPAPNSHLLSEIWREFARCEESQLGPQQGGLKGGVPPGLGQRPGYGTEEEEDASLKRPVSPRPVFLTLSQKALGSSVLGWFLAWTGPSSALCDLGPCAARP